MWRSSRPAWRAPWPTWWPGREGSRSRPPRCREIPLEDNPDARSFADGLLAGRFDVVIFETGVGVRYLAESLVSSNSSGGMGRGFAPDEGGRPRAQAGGGAPRARRRRSTSRFPSRIPGARRSRCSTPGCRSPACGSPSRNTVKPVPELTDGLERRGAVVTRVPVYRWALPEDTGPLRAALTEIAERRIGAALFTSAQQVEHVLQVAAAEGIEGAVRAAMARHVVVGSIGPTTSAALRAHGLPVDIEPEHPKSGHLVAAVAASWRRIDKAGTGRPTGGR